MTSTSSQASSVLSVRLSDQERGFLEIAAAEARTTLSDFVRRKAVEAAEMAMLERRVVVIPAERWEAFEAWATEPAKEIPGLAELRRHPPAWTK